ncbi:MAG: exopolysaccharide biosynthesis polyprenyl glycosylphosphotransferase [Solirubrobacterales bacterium]|nr:exopolysaccharide biosynthesis polyprenyl glycosylphosphotransferase [Solirubrobacterales bacterium]
MSPERRPPVGVAADGPAGEIAEVAPARGRRPRSELIQWAFEGAGYQYVTLTVDALLLLVALVVADRLNPADSYLPALLVSPVAVGLMATRRLYDAHAQISRLDRAAAIVGSTAAAAALVAALVQLTHPTATASGLIAIQFGLATALLLAWRISWATARRQSRRRRLCGRPTLIVGAGEVGARLERHLERLPEIGLIPVGFVDDDPVPGDELARRERAVLGSTADFDAIVDETGALHAIFAFQIEPDVTLRRLIGRCRDRGLTMAIVPRLFDDATNRMVLEHVAGIPVFELRQVDPKGWQFALKHGFDRGVAALGLLALSPVIGLTALAVRLSSPGPILFRQRRVGRDGQVFDVLKFRSMRPAPEGSDLPRLAGDQAPGGVEGDDRRTPVGAFIRAWSLDELPQLVNVVRGQMSLVGPRPERPELVGSFAESVRRYDERHRVRSGITGWSQVNGLGPGTSLADRAELDNWYIQNWSLWLDFKILLKTIPTALTRSE